MAKYVIQIFHYLISSFFIIYIITSEKCIALAMVKERTLHTEFEQDQYFLLQSLTEWSGFHSFFSGNFLQLLRVQILSQKLSWAILMLITLFLHE